MAVDDSIEAHSRNVLTGMRRMLIVVTIFAIAACGVAVWLFVTTIPTIHKQQSQIATQQSTLDTQQDQLTSERKNVMKFCEELAVEQYRLAPASSSALKTLDQCMAEFPQDDALPAYRAQVLAMQFVRAKTDIKTLDDAIQAANSSIKLKPNVAAYDWKGLSYCLKAQHGPASDRPEAVQSAIQTFQAEFSQFKQREDSIKAMTEFNLYCPADVKNFKFN